jgi:sigma-B regulation protein RsbU (phosphoserine phosphatase)
MGVAPELPLGAGEVELAPGELLLLYTDGLIDAPGMSRERLEAALVKPITSSQALLDRLFSLSQRLTHEPVDDVMVVVLRPTEPG